MFLGFEGCHARYFDYNFPDTPEPLTADEMGSNISLARKRTIFRQFVCRLHSSILCFSFRSIYSNFSAACFTWIRRVLSLGGFHFAQTLEDDQVYLIRQSSTWGAHVRVLSYMQNVHVNNWLALGINHILIRNFSFPSELFQYLNAVEFHI